jgi:hypothetical protein
MSILVNFSINPTAPNQLSPADPKWFTRFEVTHKSDTRGYQVGAIAFWVIGDNSLYHHKSLKMPSVKSASCNKEIIFKLVVKFFLV